nr:plasmid transfer protein [Pantoea cypripedii]
MSLSHASPDELLPEMPDSQEIPSEALPGVAGSPRQRLPFSVRKLVRTGSIVLLTLCLAGSLTTLVVIGRAVSDLTIRVNTLDAAFRSGQIGQLTSNVSAMEERLRTLEQQAATLASLPAAVQSASNEQTAFKIALSQLQEAGNVSSQSAAQLQTRVSTLEHDVLQSSITLGDINRQLTQKPAEPEKPRPATEAAKPRVKSTAKKINRSARHTVTPAAPFVLTGIERRGGQTFAVVIPRGASQISAMRLLSPGDAMLGWTLRSTEGSHAAFFMVNGSEHLLQVE